MIASYVCITWSYRVLVKGSPVSYSFMSLYVRRIVCSCVLGCRQLGLEIIRGLYAMTAYKGYSRTLDGYVMSTRGILRLK